MSTLPPQTLAHAGANADVQAPAFAVEVITCVAEAWQGFLGPATGLVGRAFAEGRVRLEVGDLRAHGLGRHRCVDDAPYGGGAGMVLAPGPVEQAIAVARRRTPGPVLMLSPRGAKLTQERLVELAAGPGVTLVCGRYEGFDERAYAYVDQVVSLGDFVLSGGDPAALCLIDGLVRLLPGVLGNATSTAEESFAQGLLEYPQYTRPPVHGGQAVPEVLRGGDHKAVARWRQEQSLALTRQHRPDLYASWAQKNRL